MKLTSVPNVGDEIKLGFVFRKIISKVIKQTGKKMYYLCLEKGADKRLLYYNPATKETGRSFERYSSTFGGTSKGGFIGWN
jgi:hypothetical protein